MIVRKYSVWKKDLIITTKRERNTLYNKTKESIMTINTCFANVYSEEYDEVKGIYKIKFLIRENCCVTFLKVIAFWFIETGLLFSVEDRVFDSSKLLTLQINLECAKNIREIERCTEFGADQVKFPYVEYSDYINRVFKAADKRISYES